MVEEQAHMETATKSRRATRPTTPTTEAPDVLAGWYGKVLVVL